MQNLCGTSHDCPLTQKEKARQENLTCRGCGYEAPVFLVDKATCYSIRWLCPCCGSKDVTDPDCTPTLDDIFGNS